MEKRILASILVLASILGVVFLPACGTPAQSSQDNTQLTHAQEATAAPTEETIATTSSPDSTHSPEPVLPEEPVPEEATPEPTPAPTPTPEPTPDPEMVKRMNSISMLNYLVVFTQEINMSRTSRLYLEKAFSELYNNTHPNAVDTRTQTEINYLFKTINAYRLITEKRDRLTFLYEQERARAIHEAIPNPLGLLSATRSFSLTGLVTSVVYMAVDSYSNYQNATQQADLKYLQDGWALDDEETAVLNEILIGTFNYMMDTCRDYQLPGELALNMKAVTDFVEWTDKDNIPRVIRFLEDEESTYQAYGPYWLSLAECYYKTGDYENCLKSIGRYESLNIGIFRKDHMLASVMPYAIDAAGQVYNEEEYVPYAAHCASIIESQTENEEWALRYFAAQTYIDLASRTGDQSYLEEAYKLVRRNVNILIDEQKKLNDAYTGELILAKEPEGATKAQKEDVKQYNKLLKEERKTELPPISEPLLLNCELLFALADQLNKSESERSTIDGMLHDGKEPMFLVSAIDRQFWFNPDTPNNDTDLVEFEADELFIPASLVTENAVITVTVKNGGDVTVIKDWVVSEVNRKNGFPYIVSYESATAKKFKYQDGMQILLSITPMEGANTGAIELEYIAKQQKKFVISSIVFEKVE